jgi:MFS family permease
MTDRTTPHGPQRTALHNSDLVRHVLSLELAAMAEWAVFLGVLVYAFDDGGARATGLASIAMLIPFVVAAPLAGALAERHRPHRVRLGGLVVQTLGYGAGAIAALMGLDTIVVLVACMIGLGALTTLRPAGAVLLPAIVRSSRELTVGNLWSGYSDSISGLLGPLLATGLLVVGGAPAVITGCAIATASAAAVSVLPKPIDPPGGGDTSGRLSALALMRRNLSDLRSRPGVLGVLTLAGAQFFVVGGLDIIIVVAAQERLGLGDSGPGVLLTLFGIGGLVGGILSTVVVRRARLAPVLLVSMVAIAAAAFLLGATLSVVAAFLLLPVLGISQTTIDMMSNVLLHRSAPPEVLASVYAVLELSAGAGLILGSVCIQVLIAVWNVEIALYGTGVFYILLIVGMLPSLRVADASADVPVVSMSLLRRLPVFASLPRAELEMVSRSAVETSTVAGETVIAQGDVGDRFYAVAQGTFAVSVNGVRVQTIGRGGGFGEIALLADIPRTATVTCEVPGSLLAIERAPFLIAVTGHDSSRQAAWGAIRTMSDDNAAAAGSDAFDAPAGFDPPSASGSSDSGSDADEHR